MSGSRGVQLRVGGQTYRVVSSADEAELHRLAEVVDTKLAAITGGRQPASPQSLLLAALALAHDLEAERARSAASSARSRAALGKLLQRVETALDALPSNGGQA